MSARRRRRYRPGRCQDCGRTRPVTVIIFWVNGMRYTVCGECIDAYRDRILAPCPPDCDACRRRETHGQAQTRS